MGLRASGPPGGSAAHLRGLNLERVLAVAMSRPDSFTRAELVAATGDRKSTRLNSSHIQKSRMPSSA